jgi:hypothetical protein
MRGLVLALYFGAAGALIACLVGLSRPEPMNNGMGMGALFLMAVGLAASLVLLASMGWLWLRRGARWPVWAVLGGAGLTGVVALLTNLASSHSGVEAEPAQAAEPPPAEAASAEPPPAEP